MRGKPASYLFVENARGGSFTSIRGARNLFRLRLRGVDSHAVFFADRPLRTSGVIRHAVMQEVLFRRGLPSPNAAVVLLAPDGRRDTLAVRLSRPHYSARAHTLAYDARPLRNVTPGLRRPSAQLAHTLPRRFGPASVFIDSGRTAGKSCVLKLNNQTPYAFVPVSVSNWSTDSWIFDPSNVYITPNSGWQGSGSDGGGLFRGCHFSVQYELAGTRSDTVTLSITNPYNSSDSPSWDCVPSDRTKYYCDVDFSQSTTTGLIVKIYFTVHRIS